MSRTPSGEPGFRLLCTETFNGRQRLAASVPTVMRQGKWVPASGHDEGFRPAAVQRPNGEVEELSTGFIFDCRADFVRARSGRSP